METIAIADGSPLSCSRVLKEQLQMQTWRLPLPCFGVLDGDDYWITGVSNGDDCDCRRITSVLFQSVEGDNLASAQLRRCRIASITLAMATTGYICSPIFRCIHCCGQIVVLGLSISLGILISWVVLFHEHHRSSGTVKCLSSTDDFCFCCGAILFSLTSLTNQMD